MNLPHWPPAYQESEHNAKSPKRSLKVTYPDDSDIFEVVLESLGLFVGILFQHFDRN